VPTPKLLPFFDCVDGVNNVLLSQTFNQFSVELPDFQEAALQTLVVQGVHLVPMLLTSFSSSMTKRINKLEHFSLASLLA
jgi:hypothetical protein